MFFAEKILYEEELWLLKAISIRKWTSGQHFKVDILLCIGRKFCLLNIAGQCSVFSSMICILCYIVCEINAKEENKRSILLMIFFVIGFWQIFKWKLIDQSSIWFFDYKNTKALIYSQLSWYAKILLLVSLVYKMKKNLLVNKTYI